MRTVLAGFSMFMAIAVAGDAGAVKVYKSTSKGLADVKVYEVDSEGLADVKVYFTDSEGLADKKVYFTTSEGLARCDVDWRSFRK